MRPSGSLAAADRFADPVSSAAVVKLRRRFGQAQDMDGVTLIDDFLDDAQRWFVDLRDGIDWDDGMAARRTASFGVAYNYSQMRYPYRPMPPSLDELATRVAAVVGFRPNNCLLNCYADGESRMGFHADQTDILVPGTGIAIVSLGAVRALRFRAIADSQQRVDYRLNGGSLLYMSAELQRHWQHAVPREPGAGARISLTFRALREALP